MLVTNPAMGIPDPVEPRMGSQVIDVPVRPLRHLLVVRDAGPHATRPQGAANINVKTSLQFERAESPDLDQLIPGTKKD